VSTRQNLLALLVPESSQTKESANGRSPYDRPRDSSVGRKYSAQESFRKASLSGQFNFLHYGVVYLRPPHHPHSLTMDPHAGRFSSGKTRIGMIMLDSFSDARQQIRLPFASPCLLSPKSTLFGVISASPHASPSDPPAGDRGASGRARRWQWPAASRRRSRG